MANKEKMTLSEMVTGYFALKARAAEIKAESDARLSVVNERTKELEQILLAELHEQGLTSTKIDGVGTFGISKRTVFNLNDPVAFRDFAFANGELDLFKITAHGDGIREYIERNEKLPPFVDKVEIESTYTRAASRRATAE